MSRTSSASSTFRRGRPRPFMPHVRTCSKLQADSQSWLSRTGRRWPLLAKSKAPAESTVADMKLRVASRRSMAEVAALARIEELGRRDERRTHMTTHEATEARAADEANRQLKAVAREMWALGDYHRFATTLVWDLGPVLVKACGISAGQRVLDVAAGSGNVAIRAAETGAQVVASDLTPENFEAGRREARACGVELEWIEADAEALPFDDGAFDVVTSSLGAMFAPDHQRVADELLRVCRPGGTIGLLAFTPEGL